MVFSDWLPKGLHFACQGSGRCCVSRGQTGFVYLTRGDRARLARSLGLSRRRFELQHCTREGGFWRLEDRARRKECRFLRANRCTVYKARPTQCRTWPFWPELMSPKAWDREVVRFCPGVGKGERVAVTEMRRVLATQTLADKELESEAAN